MNWIKFIILILTLLQGSSLHAKQLMNLENPENFIKTSYYPDTNVQLVEYCKPDASGVQCESFPTKSSTGSLFKGQPQDWDLFFYRCSQLETLQTIKTVTGTVTAVGTIALTWQLGLIKVITAGIASSLGHDATSDFPEIVQEQIDQVKNQINYLRAAGDGQIFVAAPMIEQVRSVFAACSWEYEEFLKARAQTKCTGGCHGY